MSNVGCPQRPFKWNKPYTEVSFFSTIINPVVLVLISPQILCYLDGFARDSNIILTIIIPTLCVWDSKTS